MKTSHAPVESVGDREPVKRAVDLVLAVIFGLVLSPLIGLAALMVKMTSRGPAFYGQTRVGRFGKTFRTYRIRTMQHTNAAMGSTRRAAKDAYRATWLGKFLRAVHLDELPLFLNVVMGEMSLVGPRADRPEFVAMFQAAFPRYRERQKVRPGLTGLAQVLLPPQTDTRSVGQILQCDLDYLARRGLWLDFRLMLAGFLRLLLVPRGTVYAILRLPRNAVIS